MPSQRHERFLHPEQVAPLRGRVLSVNDAEHAALLFAMLSDPTRARVLHALSLADEDVRALFDDGLRRAQQRSPARGREAGNASRDVS